MPSHQNTLNYLPAFRYVTIKATDWVGKNL